MPLDAFDQPDQFPPMPDDGAGDYLPEPVDSTPVYWARKTGSELVDAVQAKKRAWYDAAERRGIVGAWRFAYAQYYGQDPDTLGGMETQQIGFDGDEGELIAFRVNESRSFARQIVTMATTQRPAFKCMALNTDYQSMVQVESADKLITYYYAQEMGETAERELVEHEVPFGQAYGWIRWDVDAGDDVTVPQTDPQTGAPLMEQVPQQAPDGTTFMQQRPVMRQQKSGAPVGGILYAWEVYQEPNGRGKPFWRACRERASKWELAAQYPEHADKIISGSARTLDDYCVENLFGFDEESASEDDCIVDHFYHARCGALPEGRYVGICGDVILWDRPCPVPKGIPIVEFCTAKFMGTQFGYADWWDLLSINQMIDQICSDTGTNLSTFGRQVLVVDEGTDFDVDALADGNRVLTKQPGDAIPQPIMFAAMPPAAQWFLQFLISRMESISGINSVARGNPDSSVKSGTHAALYHSIALEFQSGRQAALDTYRQEWSNLLLDMIRLNASDQFVIEIAGMDERPYMAEFKKQSVAGVRRVRVETASPMLRSAAGRLQLWQEVKDLPPDQRGKAIETITTGVTRQLTRADQTCYARIHWENEQLGNGTPVPVLAGDDPFKHVPEHFAEIEARSAQFEQNPGALRVTLAHIMQHLQAYQHLDPMLATFLRIPPPPAVPPLVAAQQGQASGQPSGSSNGSEIRPRAAAPHQPPGGHAPAGAPNGSETRPAAPAQPRDTSGVKLPAPAGPPAGANVQPAPGPQQQ